MDEGARMKTGLAFAAILVAAMTFSAEAAPISKVMAAGQTLRVDFFAVLNIDCSSMGNSTVRITSGPSHGSINVHNAKSFTYYPDSNPRNVCNTRKVDGSIVEYRPALGFVGDDNFSLDVIFPNGTERMTDYQIAVK
jgi:hypothetical protein